MCPFAVNEGCDVYLDESLRRFDVVYPACGSSNSAIALTPDELAVYTPGSTWVDVCKLPEEGQMDTPTTAAQVSQAFSAMRAAAIRAVSPMGLV